MMVLITNSNRLITYQPQELADLFQAQRKWFHALFASIEAKDLLWTVPHTPYTMDWILWHMASSCDYVSQIRINKNQTDETYRGYPKYELGFVLRRDGHRLDD